MKIQDKLNSYLEDYESSVEITDGYQFDMKDTINRIELYRASKFKSGEYDSQGDKKFFFNIITPMCGNATKFIDIDRKDVIIKPLDGEDERIKAMLYSTLLRQYMDKRNIGVLFNKCSDTLPWYGSFVVKKTGDKLKYVPLKNLYFDPAVSNKDDSYDLNSPYIVEKHCMNEAELREMSSKGWSQSAIEALIEYTEEHDEAIEVYEFHSYFDNETWSEDGESTDNEKYFKGVVFLTCNTKIEDAILFKEKEDSFPYKKVDFITIEGRGLGLGIAEQSFDGQIRWNEMTNQKAKSMKLSAKHIFQTRDTQIEANVLTDIMDGDIMKVRSEITPLVNEERNLQAYKMEEDNVMNITRAVSNAQDILMGEPLPSRTPFRLGVMQQQNATKFFDFIRQNIGMFWDEVFEEWIIPEFEKEANKEQILEVYDTDTIDLLVERDVNTRINQAIVKYVISTGNFPTKEEVDLLKQQLTDEQKRKPTQFAELIKNYFKDFKKHLTIDISGEQKATAQEVETMTNFLQLLAQNPGIMQNPDLVKMLNGIASRVGISPMTFSGQAQVQPTLGQAGGMPPVNAGGPPQPQQM